MKVLNYEKVSRNNMDVGEQRQELAECWKKC